MKKVNPELNLSTKKAFKREYLKPMNGAAPPASQAQVFYSLAAQLRYRGWPRTPHESPRGLH